MNKSGFACGTWLFLRILAVIHAVAFISCWTQLDGLVGPHGLLPATRFFGVVHSQLGGRAFAELPSLCWLFGAGWFLHALCAIGVALALLLFAGVAPAPCLALLWVCYLSLAGAGQIFFEFQWDSLLLETTLLAVFLAPWTLCPGWRLVEPPRLARWLLWWLLFRLMLLSGLVKLASGDPSWRHLTALTFHYETQPLPTPLAWYASQLPSWLQRLSCALMFVVELVAPFALLAGRRLRHAAVLALIGLQVLIALTGNYTFFNFLGIALCFLCLDDAFFRRGQVEGRRGVPPRSSYETRRDAASTFKLTPSAPSWLLRSFATVVVFCTFVEAIADFVPSVASARPLAGLESAIAPFRSLNNYGLFAVMTTTRPELIFEGSDDGIEWQPYEFPHKPGDLARRPDFVAPHQPRLDWQLWFAALGSLDQNRWVIGLCEHILTGTPEVMSLFARNPFPAHPPRYIRVVRYEYHFTDAAERAATGNWWKRTMLDYYVPPARLN